MDNDCWMWLAIKLANHSFILRLSNRFSPPFLSSYEYICTSVGKTYHFPVCVAEVPNRTVEFIDISRVIDQQGPGNKEVPCVCLTGTMESVRFYSHSCLSTCVFYLRWILPENLQWQAVAQPRWRNSDVRSNSWSQIWTSQASRTHLSFHLPPWKALVPGCSFLVSLCTLCCKWMRLSWWCWILLGNRG